MIFVQKSNIKQLLTHPNR